ncbi:NfeD family protein [Halospeciosus flavus]|uniref:NfeD family protein n=1 Tax=Halospeciosus flavus TaxID=3032283 RepID=A0ABD5Z5T0_9EURY|nr:NfeD family protein [Halospeciosus flavus]
MAELFGQSLSFLLVVSGVFLCIAEALAPGAHFVVVGVALLVAGLLGLLVPGLGAPLALAAVVLVVGAAALYGYRRFDIYQGTDTGKTEGSSGLAGKRGRVTERVTDRSGQVELYRGGGFDATYAARTVTGEIPEGAEIVVVDPGGGNVLTVEAIDGSGEDEIDRELATGRRETDAERERTGE